jgi:hypothetical protein
VRDGGGGWEEMEAAIGGEKEVAIGEESNQGHGRMAARVSLRGGPFIPQR